MPNTLIHAGIQGLTTRAIVNDVDLRVVYLACVLPDLPWITRRLMQWILDGVDRIDLILYSGVQSSLLFCVLLSLVIASVSRTPSNTFSILVTGCLFHLLLDATQDKPGNGVLLFAPFDWQPWSFRGLWTDHPIFMLLSLAGAFYLLFSLKWINYSPFWRGGLKRVTLACSVLAIYFAAPTLFIEKLFQQDAYSTKALVEIDSRPGKPVSIDRALITSSDGSNTVIRVFTGEEFTLLDKSLKATRLLSLRGEFVDRSTIRVSQHHVHTPGVRDYATVLGLLIILMVWLITSMRQFFTTHRDKQ